jgi:branched-chain amino acid transport system permease protein
MFGAYSEYFYHLCILIALYGILAQSFNLVFGLGCLLNLAHVAAYAIGAYTTALLSVDQGCSFLVCVVSSIITSCIFSLLIGSISLRLDKDYFAIGSLAFSSIVIALLINWKELTRGVLGIPGIPRPEFAGFPFEDNLSFLYLITIFLVISQITLILLFKSNLGRALRAQAEFEQAALSLGINSVLMRNIAFMLASGLAGLAGSMYAYYINYIDPTSFSINESVFILSIVIIGKPGSFFGVLAATVFLVLLPEPLRFIDISPAILGPMRQLLHACILFGMVFLRRNTLFNMQRVV